MVTFTLRYINILIVVGQGFYKFLNIDKGKFILRLQENKKLERFIIYFENIVS